MAVFDILDLWLIEPIRIMLLVVLEQSYRLTGSHGGSLLLLSVFFNLALMPAYHWAEQGQRRERRCQQAMKPKVDEFKQVFGGQERYMMLRALYRQHAYHPVYALRSLAPLLIQIPFFIATFGLLSGYEPFEGACFLIFSDLSRPDGLIGGINLMPFVMTAVNLFALFLYTRSTSRTEQAQGAIVALVFLLLLYVSPVGLVLYWTFNNMISVIKSLVYARGNQLQEAMA